ncbi:tryptophan halogenase family protein [Arenicella xantha]|uniref:Tryptophan halogenase n=1 Tax=Arenicella xantha TaxID=644221 RepID=A0A395JIW6_9GAMM|nr:tryptophan halogenase family protein [Arenicella xantha]RBP48728.1 tryptophan halogenase [Arenicella xantha]
MQRSVRNIVIVGGGTAGWLTAGILASHYSDDPDTGLTISLVESPDVATIGVGEGTWPSMRTTLQKIGISETEFMRACDVSLKQGSRFNSWVTGANDYYYHPFSMPQGYSEFNLVPFWQTVREQVSFTDAVSPQGQLADRGLAPKQISTPEYAFQVNYGYHLDAGKFAEFLRRHCTEKLGVKHISDHVQTVHTHPNGDINGVHTSQHGLVTGDLFVDCTGFNGLLIDKHYEIPFNSVADTLFNDRALAVHVPYQRDNEPIASATLSTAQSAGWIWDIGLPSRRGVGHVYSSEFTSDEAAEVELRQYLEALVGRRQAHELTVRKIQFKPGHRASFWHRNCVAIGLSAGFVEPLEASALVLVEYAANMLAEQLPANRDVMDITAKRFNHKFAYRWQQIIEFLKLHYVLNQRDDAAYWQAHRHQDSVPDSLREKLKVWRHQAPWHLDTPHIDELFPSASYQYVLYGMGFVTYPQSLEARNASQQLAQANQLLHDNAKRTASLLNAMPNNRELINKVAEFGFQKI